MYSVLTKLLSQGWVDGALGCLLAAGIGPSLDHSTTKYVLPTMCEYQGGETTPLTLDTSHIQGE